MSHLHASDGSPIGRYHDDCRCKFMAPCPVKTAATKKRDIASMDHAFEDIVQAMESDHTDHTTSQIQLYIPMLAHPYQTSKYYPL